MGKITGRIQAKLFSYLCNKKAEQLFANRGEIKGPCVGAYLLEESRYLEKKEYAYRPLISIFLIGKPKKKKYFFECIKSICSQMYVNWEICLSEGSTFEEDKVREILINEKKTQSIRRVLNLAEAQGDFIAMVDVNDVLPVFSLSEMVNKLNEHENYFYIYSDEDTISSNGKRSNEPFFKPDWSPDLMLSFFYTRNLSLYHADLAKEVGGLNWECKGDIWYDFGLRFTEELERGSIGHIPKVLYHRRENTDDREQGAKATIEEALKRRQIKGEVVKTPLKRKYNVVYKVSNNPLVSIVIPSKDNDELLVKCLNSIEQYTDYKHYEIIIVDNGSAEKAKNNLELLAKEKGYTYFYEKMEFNFSRMCNIGAGMAKGDYILFLNDDIEIIQKEWLEMMLGQGCQEWAGGIGAKLLYPNSDKIQHVGVGIPSHGPDHVLIKRQDVKGHYFGRNQLTYNYLTVTGACLLVKKEKYLEVGGFDETFPIAYNDVDFCFKLYKKGYYNAVRNDVVLYHHESYSRGDDSASSSKLDRIRRELERLFERYPEFAKGDPFYNVNLRTKSGLFFKAKERLEIHDVRRTNVKGEEYDKFERFADAHVDRMKEEDGIYLVGWALADMDYDFLYDKCMVFQKENDETLEVPLNKVYREDIREIFGEKAAFSGYTCKISRELFEGAGEYRIGIVGRYRWLRRFIWIDERFMALQGK